MRQQPIDESFERVFVCHPLPHPQHQRTHTRRQTQAHASLTCAFNSRKLQLIWFVSPSLCKLRVWATNFYLLITKYINKWNSSRASGNPTHSKLIKWSLNDFTRNIHNLTLSSRVMQIVLKQTIALVSAKKINNSFADNKFVCLIPIWILNYSACRQHSITNIICYHSMQLIVGSQLII